MLRTLASAAARPALRAHATVSFASRSKHTLPELPYAYNALEPSISEAIMKLHHQKHHQTYVNGLNDAEEKYASALASGSVKEQIALQAALKFNGGGHLNHSLFWKNLAPSSEGGGKLPSGPLSDAIKSQYGSLDDLKKQMNAAAAGIQGSGWAWLGLDAPRKELDILTTANQDPLITHVPLIGIDMWEHAFYLQHENRKPDYLANIWDVINFEEANARYVAALK